MIQNPERSVLEEIIKEEDIYIDNALKTRQEVLKFCAQKIHPKIKEESSFRVFWEKTLQADATNIVLPSGLYIPHLKFPDIDKIMSIMAITPSGAKDNVSGTLFYCTVFFLSPLKPAFFQKHLNTLSWLSKNLNTQNIGDISKLDSAAGIYAFLAKTAK